MFAPPPQVITITICSVNTERLLDFYREIGVLFNTEHNGNGQKLYSYVWSYTHYNFEFRFEIYAVENSEKASKNIKLTFFTDEIDEYIEGLIKEGGKMLKGPWNTQQYRHVLFADPDGNCIEFITRL
jgi:predicted enzyme related to lactoylglutathione lyase